MYDIKYEDLLTKTISFNFKSNEVDIARIVCNSIKVTLFELGYRYVSSKTISNPDTNSIDLYIKIKERA